MTLAIGCDGGAADALDAGLGGMEEDVGIARATRTAAAARAETTGCAQDAVEDGAPDAALLFARRRRPTNGIRPFSTRSPSLERIAGSTVSEPSIATATTSIAPTEKDMNVLSPERNMPAIAIRTVMPETSTARPEVAAAAASAALSLRPALRSSRSRRM